MGQAHHLLHPGEVPEKSQPRLAQKLFPVNLYYQLHLSSPRVSSQPPPSRSTLCRVKAVTSSSSQQLREPPLSSPGPRQLGQLEAGVHADCVAQLLPQDAFLAVVGKLEEVETRRGGGETPTWLFLADGEEAP